MTALDLDLDTRVLVGELPEIPCEEPTHERSPLHGGPATHYARWLHGCGFPAQVVALCQPIVMQTLADIAAGQRGRCRTCGHYGLMSEFISIIGPIGGGAS